MTKLIVVLLTLSVLNLSVRSASPLADKLASFKASFVNLPP